MSSIQTLKLIKIENLVDELTHVIKGLSYFAEIREKGRTTCYDLSEDRKELARLYNEFCNRI